eukprot:Phypoly_transcript_10768.p1 GENE.Phypoly_transcript_10768~~Phypoly_transcript_10768.p1  ORF type:complete len:354 (+),score=52.08 Phypoly_transcript_10768:202-1263(+)
MKQWQFTKSGSPRDVLCLVEVPIPTTCADNEVLIKVSHVGFNSAYMYKLMAHYSLTDPINAFKGKPGVPEMDVSGIVCDLKGKKVQNLNTGDRVFGAVPPWFFNVGNGVLREYVLIKYDHLARVPDNISLCDAASLVATGITVHYMMKERLKLREGDRVFITGASGGVGVLAVQLAHHLVGPTGLVVASCSRSKITKVKELGADEVIDYTAHDLPEYLKEKFGDQPFDVIYDIVGSDHRLFTNSPNYLAPSGTFYTIGLEFGDTLFSGIKRIAQVASAMALPTYLGGVPRKHIFESTGITQSRIEGVAELAKEGTLKAVVDSVFKFDDVLGAYDRLASRGVVGRVVVQVNELE